MANNGKQGPSEPSRSPRAVPASSRCPGLMRITVKRKPATKAQKGINPFTKEEVMFKAPSRRGTWCGYVRSRRSRRWSDSSGVG